MSVNSKVESSTHNFAARVSSLREGKGYTQQELADFVGVSLRTIQNWEDATPKGTEPRGKDLRKLCEVLGVSVGEMLSGEVSPQGSMNRETVLALREESQKDLDILITFGTTDPKAAECIKYVADYLNAHGSDPDQVRWFLVELKNRFPLAENIRLRLPSSAPESPEQRAARLGVARGRTEAQERARKSPTGEPSGEKR